MASPEDWIKGYRFHEKALEFLNIYDVMNDWDHIIYETRVENNPIENREGKESMSSYHQNKKKQINAGDISKTIREILQTSGNSFGLTSCLSPIKKKTNAPRIRIAKNHLHQRKPYHNDDGNNSASLTSVYSRKNLLKTYICYTARKKRSKAIVSYDHVKPKRTNEIF